MRRELGLHLAGRAKYSLVQRIEILAHGAGCICRVDARRIPFFLRRRVLFVGIRLDQAGVNRHALATDQALFDAPCHRRLK